MKVLVVVLGFCEGVGLEGGTGGKVAEGVQGREGEGEGKGGDVGLRVAGWM
jgi:hypothetical protein